MACPPSWPGYQHHSIAGTSSAQERSTGDPASTTTTVRGCTAATARISSTWRPGSDRSSRSRPSVSQSPSRPTTTTAASRTAAASTARSKASAGSGGAQRSSIDDSEARARRFGTRRAARRRRRRQFQPTHCRPGCRRSSARRRRTASPWRSCGAGTGERRRGAVGTCAVGDDRPIRRCPRPAPACRGTRPGSPAVGASPARRRRRRRTSTSTPGVPSARRRITTVERGCPAAAPTPDSPTPTPSPRRARSPSATVATSVGVTRALPPPWITSRSAVGPTTATLPHAGVERQRRPRSAPARCGAARQPRPPPPGPRRRLRRAAGTSAPGGRAIGAGAGAEQRQPSALGLDDVGGDLARTRPRRPASGPSGSAAPASPDRDRRGRPRAVLRVANQSEITTPSHPHSSRRIVVSSSGCSQQWVPCRRL